MAKSKTNPNADETPFLDLLGSILCDEKNGLDAAMEREISAWAAGLTKAQKKKLIESLGG